MRRTAYKKQGAPDWWSLFIIYFLNEKLAYHDWHIIVLPVHTYHWCMESKGHISMFIQVFGKSQIKISYINKLFITACKKELQSLRAVIVIGLNKTSEVI
jgi:hypothetical protein